MKGEEYCLWEFRRGVDWSDWRLRPEVFQALSMYTNDGNDGPLSEDTLWVAVNEKILGRHETRAYNLDDEGAI